MACCRNFVLCDKGEGYWGTLWCQHQMSHAKQVVKWPGVGSLISGAHILMQLLFVNKLAKDMFFQYVAGTLSWNHCCCRQPPLACLRSPLALSLKLLPKLVHVEMQLSFVFSLVLLPICEAPAASPDLLLLVTLETVSCEFARHLRFIICEVRGRDRTG